MTRTRDWEVIIDPTHEHRKRVFHIPEDQIHAFVQLLVWNDVPDFRVRHEPEPPDEVR